MIMAQLEQDSDPQSFHAGQMSVQMHALVTRAKETNLSIDDRKSALRELAEMGDGALCAIADLQYVFVNDTNADIRYFSGACIEKISHNALFGLLPGIMDLPDLQFRKQIFECAKCEQASIDLLHALALEYKARLSDPFPTARRGILDFMGLLGQRCLRQGLIANPDGKICSDIWATLSEAILGSGEETSAMALEATIKIFGPETGRDKLVGLLKENPEVGDAYRQTVVFLADKLGAQVVDALVWELTVLGDFDPNQIRTLIQALAKIGRDNPEAQATVIERLGILARNRFSPNISTGAIEELGILLSTSDQKSIDQIMLILATCVGEQPLDRARHAASLVLAEHTTHLREQHIKSLISGLQYYDEKEPFVDVDSGAIPPYGPWARYICAWILRDFVGANTDVQQAFEWSAVHDRHIAVRNRTAGILKGTLG